MATRLEEVLAIANATSEESVDDVLTLLHPDSHKKEEIQESFEEVIGYDPTSYFDRKELDEMLESIRDDIGTPSDVKDYITNNKEELVTETYNQFDSDRLEHLRDAVNKVLKEKFGWDCFGFDDIEDDEEELDEDDDF